mgnify:FL=1
MLNKLRRFIDKCNNFVNIYPKKLDKMDENITRLQDDNKEITKKLLEYQINLNVLEGKIQNLEFKLDNVSSNFDCVNLEYMNLDWYMPKNKVLIIGFYGAPNLGDELMLHTILKKLLLHKDTLDITVMMSENYNFDITKYPKCKTIHYPKNIMDINTLANYYDIVIFGGGALLDDSGYNLYSNRLSLNTILVNLAYRMITCEKKVILYGLSSNNKLVNKEYINKLKFITENATYFSLRDTNSLEVLKECDLDTSKIKIVHDLVYTYNYSKYITEKNKSSVLKVGIIYICNEENYKVLCNLTSALGKYLNDTKQKYKMVMIPFYEYLNNDTNYYQKLVDELKDNNIEVLTYPNPIEDIFNIISKLDICISMRYHGTLIGNMLGTPTLNLLYDAHRHYINKVNYLYDKYGYNNYQVQFSKVSNEKFIDTFKTVCKMTKNININKKIYMEANKQIDDVINSIVIENEEEK